MRLLRKHNTSGAVGLDIDGSYMAAVQFRAGRVERAASAELDSGVVTDGEVRDPERLSQALKSFFRDNGLAKNVYLGVANQHIVLRHMEIPRIEDDGERQAAVRFQAAESIAMPLEDAVIDYQVIGDAPEGNRQQIVVVAARRTMVEALVEAVRGAGLKPLGIDLNAFAVIRCLSGATGEDSSRVYCHLGGGVANLALARGSDCIFARPLAASWRNADGAEDLAEELRLSIDYHRAQDSSVQVAELVLSGPGARDETLVEDLQRVLGLEVTAPDPFGGRPAALASDAEDPYRHTVAVGLALGAAA